MTTAHAGSEAVFFRCLDDGHLIEEVRKPSGPLAARQSTWCVAHDCPAVGLTGPLRPVPSDTDAG